MQIQAGAEEKRRADEIQIQEAEIEADKERALKELELHAQAQANTRVTADLTHRNGDAKSRRLQDFMNEKDKLPTFTCFVSNVILTITIRHLTRYNFTEDGGTKKTSTV